MIRFLEWVARRRVAVLAATLVGGVVFEVLLRTVPNDLAWELILAFSTLLPVVLLFMVYSVRFFHPATLVARPGVPAFEVPANPGAVLGAAGFTLLAVRAQGIMLSDLAGEEDLWFAAGPMVIWIGVLVPHWLAALGRLGVRIRPDGIVDRQVFGSLFVPWQALAIPYPAFAYDAQQVTLFLARPEVVRRRGFRYGAPATLPAAGVNAELLARAIHEYTNRRELRAAIGSEAELARFLAIPQIRALAQHA